MNVPSHRQFDAAVPRYTSYPTAPHFSEAIGPANTAAWLSELPMDVPISLYVHVPFCDRLCWFCACHTKQTLRYEPVTRFLEGLRREIGLVRDNLPGRVPVKALHFGGGSPTMLRPNDIVSLMDTLQEVFAFTPATEISIEADPNDMDDSRFDALSRIGVTRASLGVQDFDARVQKAINRDQTFEVTRATVEGFRSRGVRSLNLDLLYGLPHQNPATLERTIDQALSLEPDRIALFGYAHVPWFKTHQKMIDEKALPDGLARLEQSRLASDLIAVAGYVPIGIDHFARPGDSLSRAAVDGRLHRNFQGYTDDDCQTLLGFGPSAISRFKAGYAQNIAATGGYLARVAGGMLATRRGLAFSDEDRIRGWLIERLMCDFAVCEDDINGRFGAQGKRILEAGLAVASTTGRRMEQKGSVWEIPSEDRSFARVFASAFDAYLGRGSARHSVAV